jgi:Mg-chelatase subunit ChlD
MTHFRPVLLFLAAFPLLVAAQQHNLCQKRVLLVNVVDAHGQQVSALTGEQFRANLQGQPVKVMSAKFGAGPQRILILVDVSGSMWTDRQQWELVKLAVEDVVSAGPGQAQLALATFSNRFEANVPFGKGREAVREAILNLNPTSKSIPKRFGGTALNDAILEAADMFGSPHPGDVIYVITDGLDNESKNTTGKLLQYLGQRSIRLFATVIHNNRFIQFSEGPDGPELLGKTAKETGGYYTILETDRSGNLALNASTNMVRPLYGLMSSFYLLDIELPKEPDKPWELKLAVVDTNGDKKKGTMVLYPRNIFPCAAAN